LREHLKQIGKHASIYTGANFLNKALGFFLIPIYVAHLSRGEIGTIGIVLQVSAFLGILFTSGLNYSWARFYYQNDYRDENQKTFLSSIILFLMGFGLLFALLLTFFGKPIMAVMVKGIDFDPYMILAIWSAFFMVIFNLKQQLFRIRQQSIAFGALSILKSALVLILSIVLIVGFDFGSLGRLIPEIGILGVLFALSLVLLHKDMNYRIDISSLKKSLKYGLPFIPHTLTVIVMGLADKLILNNYHNLATVGVFQIAVQFGSIMSLIVISSNMAYNPFFLKIVTEDKEKAKPVIAKLTKYAVLFYSFTAILISSFARELILVFTNADYIEGVQVIAIFVFTFFFFGLYQLMANKIMFEQKAARNIAFFTIIAGVVNILLNFYLIPSQGMIGASIASLVSNIVLFLASFIYAQRFFKIDYPYKSLFILFIIVLVVLFFNLYLINQFNLPLLLEIVCKLVSVGIAFIALFKVGVINKSEYQNIMDIYQKHKPKKS